MLRHGTPLACTVGIVLVLVSPAMAVAGEATPSFAKDVAPILYKNCVTCHRPGEVAPMSLLTYQAARPWAKAIKEKVVSREMPPWHADSSGLAFRNDRRLSQEEINTIVAWVDAGAPKGDDADLPPAPAFAEGWEHPSRSPDLIVPMPVEYEIPADGAIPYVNFHAKVPLTADAFAEAVETRPGNRAAVHHITVNPMEFKQPPAPGPEFAPVGATAGNRGRENAVSRRQSSILGLFTPGQGFEQFPAGSGLRVKGGPTTYFRFNMHYQLTGKPETDRSAVGIWLHRDPIQFEMIRNGGIEGTVLAEGTELVDGTPGQKATGTYAVIPNIPPRAANYKVVGVTPFEEARTIYQFNPHAHLRGKDFTYRVIYPDGQERTLLHVPAYDFNWQMIYQLETPLQVPAGSKLVITAHYDNSLKNKYNPGPEKEVIWAEQSWEEMFVPFIMYSIDATERPKPTTQDQQQ